MDILSIIGAASVGATLAGMAWVGACEASDRGGTRRAERDAAEQAVHAMQDHAHRLSLCTQGDHRMTIDADHPTMVERCVDCGMRELYGYAFESGSNKVPRRR